MQREFRVSQSSLEDSPAELVYDSESQQSQAISVVALRLDCYTDFVLDI